LTTDIEDTIRCPRCGGRDIRHSLPRGWKDSLLLALRRHPFRCRACKCRFYRSGLARTGEHPSDKPVSPGGSKVV
jgi:hypothetical protein